MFLASFLASAAACDNAAAITQLTKFVVQVNNIIGRLPDVKPRGTERQQGSRCAGRGAFATASL
jgi:hypothetical protein